MNLIRDHAYTFFDKDIQIMQKEEQGTFTVSFNHNIR